MGGLICEEGVKEGFTGEGRSQLPLFNAFNGHLSKITSVS
jgi:hypothetical protein